MSMNKFKLDKEPKIDSGFKIPENYFETFSKKIQIQLQEKETKVVPLISKRKKWIMAVAAILILALMIPVYNKIEASKIELDETTLEDYITDQTSINQYDLVSLLEEEDIQNIKVELPIENETIEELLYSNSNIEHYIIE